MDRAQQGGEQYLTARAGGFSISMDTELCKACDVCVELCPTDVYEARDGHSAVPRIATPQDCTGCLRCELACPDFALRVESHE